MPNPTPLDALVTMAARVVSGAALIGGLSS